jgi:hypothetical protein
LALNDEEVHDETAEDIGAGKNVAIAEVNGAGYERCEEGEEEVPKPKVDKLDTWNVKRVMLGKREVRTSSMPCSTP